jgi:acetolactate synthase-1/2/3 large subunit
MNGAERLIHTLADGGVELCFANPGTSEMHLVAALDRTRRMRCVLGLFEGVVAGMADGYARMAGKPAATLLHLAPGLANAGANLHNARKARTPMVNLVGDHARRHLAFEAPLTGDVEGTARPVSHSVRRAGDAAAVGQEGALALADARGFPGRIATLVLPADVAWEPAGGAAAVPAAAGPEPVDEAQVEAAATALGGEEPAVLILGFRALADPATLRLAGAIAARTGAALMAPTANPRTERGGGLPPVARIPYVVEQAREVLARFRRAVLVETPEPVAFFAYPETPSRVLPEACAVRALARPGQCGVAAIARLAERLGVGEADAPVAPEERPSPPAAGAVTPESLAQAVAAVLPADAVVVDESVSAGRGLFPATVAGPRHTWLSLTGGAIGIGPPLAAGAAVGAPGRKILALQADGSALYTPQALWTQAHEGLDVTTVVLANRGYQILKGELAKVGANPGRTALDMMELAEPAIDWIGFARSLGVEGERVDDAGRLAEAIGRGLATPGPYVVEAVLA